MRQHSTHLVAILLAPLLLFYLLPAVAADGPTAPAAPTNLSMTLPKSTQSLPPGSWISATQVELRFQVQVSSGPLVPEIEIEPIGTPFVDQSNFTGSTLTGSGMAVVDADSLLDGVTYHWQARVHDSTDMASPWVRFAGAGVTTPDLGVDQDPPSRPIISSSTNPNENRWYNVRAVHLTWSSRDALSGVKGYSFLLERRAHVIQPGSLTTQPGVWLPHLADGIWFLAVRAQDRAGNWSPTATYRLQLDRQLPGFSWLSPSRFTFNPYQGPVTFRFRVTKESSALLSLYRVGDRKPTSAYWYPHLAAGQITTITWSGKRAKGLPVAEGYYFFSVRVVDHANNIVRLNAGGIVVKPEQPHLTPTGQVLYADGGKEIIVSLSRQTLYAYDGIHLVLQTYVTTGNPSLPTPPGAYSIFAKYSPFQFNSPWPPGSPYWYPPSWVSYAMEFIPGGYFLHDAPWRSVFGPGSDGPGQPGTNYGGTHGCVNIPPGPTQLLWNWAPIGTPVLVVN